MVRVRQFLQFIKIITLAAHFMAGAAPRKNSALGNAQIFIGHHQGRINFQFLTQAGAIGASAIRVIK